MHQFGGVGAEDVNPENAQIIGGYQQLEHAVRVADNLTAGQLAIPRDTHFVGDRALGEFDLGGADEGDLRNGVDPERL